MIHKVSQQELEADDNTGRCDYCGEIAYNVEPDARNYKCESCGQEMVFGLFELMLMNKIEITD